MMPALESQSPTRRHPKSLNWEKERYSTLLLGVGGQGVLTAAKVLGLAASQEGLPVNVGQLHGMTQRGGSVECPVLFGAGKSCFLTGPANLVVAFEAAEALHATPHLGPQTSVVLNRGAIIPFEITRSQGRYPEVEKIVAHLAHHSERVFALNAFELVDALGERRSLNLFMLGALAGLDLLPLESEAVWAAALKLAPAHTHAANRAAFEGGVEWGRSQSCDTLRGS